jgi:hypothetical protein
MIAAVAAAAAIAASHLSKVQTGLPLTRLTSVILGGHRP